MTPQLPAANTGLKIVRLFFSILAALLITLTLFALLRAGIFYSLYTWLLAKVVETTALDLWQSRALTLALLALATLFPWHLLVLPWIKGAKRQVALWIGITTLALAGMEFITRDIYFSRADGQPQKYYIQTLDGFKLSDAPDTDPVYGIAYQPITQDIAKQYLLWKTRGTMQEPAVQQGQYFSPSTGEPLAWYAKTPDNTIEVFSLPGFHPKYGTKLLPVTTEIVAVYEKQQAEADRQRQEKMEAQKRKEQTQAAQRAKAEAIRKARAEREQQAQEEARLKEPLHAGRYLFQEPRPSGTIDGLKFTLSEVDLKAEAILVHLEVENVGVDAKAETPAGERRTIRLDLISQNGAIAKRSAIHIKEGALSEGKNSISFPSVGKRGAFVMEFARQEDPTTFSITVNDHPIFSAINLHKALFQSF